MSVIHLDWGKIDWGKMPSTGLQDLRYEEVFRDGLGTFRGRKARIEVDPTANPRYCKASGRRCYRTSCPC